MSTKERTQRSEKLAAGRKMLRQYQNTQTKRTSSMFTIQPPSSSMEQDHAPPPQPLQAAVTAGLGLSANTPDLPNLLAPPTDDRLIAHAPGDKWTEINVEGPYTPEVFAGDTPWDAIDEPVEEQQMLISDLHKATEWKKASEDSTERVSKVTDVDSIASPWPDMQAHNQTIDILVSQNNSLQSQLASLETELRTRTEMNERLQKRLIVVEGDMKETVLREREVMEGLREQQVRTLQRELEKKTTELEDVRQENEELISRVTSQEAQLQSLQKTVSELRTKLDMAKLLNQQLSTESPSSHPSQSSAHSPAHLTGQLEELHGEVVRLGTVVRSVSSERDQALGDLDALRDAMVQRQEEASEKLREVHAQLMDSQAEKVFLSEQLRDLQEKQDQLTQQISTEHAQQLTWQQAAMETLQREKEELQRQLQSQEEEKARLSRSQEQLQMVVRERERESERLRESAVDSQRMLDTMNSDREALSRAIAQNQQLKSQLAELQEAFVKMSQQNMQLATELETERGRVSQLQTEVRTASLVGGWTGGEDKEEERADHPHLSETLKATELEEERDSIKQQLQVLSEARDSLQSEVIQLQYQLTTRQSESISPVNDRGSPTDDGPAQDTANQTVDLLSDLQANFNALQERYVAVMTEKAELLEQMEQSELTIGRLSGETETIGEYIMLYQRQREALRDKFKEKDKFIQRLVSEKTAAQAQLTQAQKLVQQLLANTTIRHQNTAPTSPSPPPPSSPSSPSSLPIHLRPLPCHHQHNHTSPPPSAPTTPTKTVETIYQLLAVMGGSGEGVRSEGVRATTAPCNCCSGDLIVV